MVMWIKKIILILAVCSIAYGANNFSGDTNCVALWRFENGALTTDSIGTNTLISSGTPVADTVDYKEGSACVDLELSESDFFYIADTDLAANFPLKNGGTGTFSVCGWFKSESLSANQWLVSKHLITSNKQSFYISNNDGTFQIGLGYSNTYEVISYGTSVTTGRWYHFGVTFNNTDNTYRIRIWDDTAGALLGSDTAGTTVNATINVTDAVFNIGAGRSATAYFDGRLDEIIFFKDILSANEIDQIRSGTYGAAAGGNSQVIIVEEL